MAKSGALRLYRSYVFQDKDPVIDRVKTIVQDEGLSYAEVQIISGVRASTLTGWFTGPVRKPQYATVAAVTAALGYEQKFVRARKLDYDAEIKKAKSEIANGTGKWQRIGRKKRTQINRRPSSERRISM